ncbi:MAG: hypothetical protein AAFQ45_08910 [Pseudomonadota bacterium]
MGRKLDDSEIKTIIESVHEQDDPRESVRLLDEEIDARKADGRPVPQDLIKVRKSVHLDCMSESQGR